MIQEKEKQSQAETQEQGEDWMQIAFAAQSENEGFARTAVAAFVSCLDPTIDELADIKTAVSEAVTKLYYSWLQSERRHDLAGGKPVRTDVVCGGYGRGTRNQRHQTGAGTIVYDTTGSGTFRGMGFSFMEAFMDAVEVESSPGKGTRVVMKKEIR